MNALPLDLEYSLTEQDFLRLPLPANNNGNLDLTPDTGSVSMGLLEEMKRRSAAAIAGDKSPAGFSIVHTTPWFTRLSDISVPADVYSVFSHNSTVDNPEIIVGDKKHTENVYFHGGSVLIADVNNLTCLQQDVRVRTGDRGGSTSIDNAKVIIGGDGEDVVTVTGDQGLTFVRGIEMLQGGEDFKGTIRTGDKVEGVMYTNGIRTLIGGDGGDELILTDTHGLRYVDGGNGDDIVKTMTTDSALLDGGNGNDFLIAQEWNVLANLFGGNGNDTLYIGGRDAQNWSYASGENGNDVLSSKHGGMLDGGSGDDTLIGGGKTVMIGWAGDDTYYVGWDDRIIVGMTDTGWDTIRLQQSGDVVNLDLGTDIGSVRVASRDDGTIMVTSDALSAWVGHIVPNTNNGYQELHIVGTNGILDVRQKIG